MHENIVDVESVKGMKQHRFRMAVPTTQKSLEISRLQAWLIMLCDVFICRFFIIKF